MFKGKWNKKLSKLFILLSGYVSFIAFAVVGGYCLVKSDDEELKDTTKKVFIISLIYYAICAVFLVLGDFGGMSSNYYGSGFYKFINITSNLIEIAKIVVYSILMLMVVFDVKLSANEENDDNKTKTEDVEDVEDKVVVDAEVVENENTEKANNDNE